MEPLTKNIEVLLATKDYEELTTAEREQVIQSCGQQEYEQLRQVVLSGKALAQEPCPPPSLKANLMKAFRQKHQRRNIPLHSITLPFWQAAAIAACMVLMGQFVRFGPVYAQTPAIAWEANDSLWFKKVTQIVADTALAVFSTDGQIKGSKQKESSIAAIDIADLPSEEFLPQPVSDTPGWARRSALGTLENTPLFLMVH
jgi:hypothetical protein